VLVFAVPASNDLEVVHVKAEGIVPAHWPRKRGRIVAAAWMLGVCGWAITMFANVAAARLCWDTVIFALVYWLGTVGLLREVPEGVWAAPSGRFPVGWYVRAAAAFLAGALAALLVF